MPPRPDLEVVACVASRTQPNVVYQVKRSTVTGVLSCDCPAWRFAKKDAQGIVRRTCKHVRAIEAEINERPMGGTVRTMVEPPRPDQREAARKAWETRRQASPPPVEAKPRPSEVRLPNTFPTPDRLTSAAAWLVAIVRIEARCNVSNDWALDVIAELSRLLEWRVGTDAPAPKPKPQPPPQPKQTTVVSGRRVRLFMLDD